MAVSYTRISHPGVISSFRHHKKREQGEAMKQLLMCLVCGIVLSQSVQGGMKFGGGICGGAAIQPLTVIGDLPKLGYNVKRPVQAELYRGGFGFGANGYLNITKWLSTRVGFEYMSFSASTSKLVDDMSNAFREAGVTVQPSELGATGGSLSVIDLRLVAIGKLPTGTLFTPYASFGPVIAHASSIDFNLKLAQYNESFTIDGQWSPGITYGIGTEISLGRVSLFVEVNDIIAWSGGNSWGPSQFLLGVVY
jgi:hypothetical protein